MYVANFTLVVNVKIQIGPNIKTTELSSSCPIDSSRIFTEHPEVRVVIKKPYSSLPICEYSKYSVTFAHIERNKLVIFRQNIFKFVIYVAKNDWPILTLARQSQYHKLVHNDLFSRFFYLVNFADLIS